MSTKNQNHMNEKIEEFGLYWEIFEHGIDHRGVSFRDALYDLVKEISKDAYLEGCLNDRSPRILYSNDRDNFEVWFKKMFGERANEEE